MNRKKLLSFFIASMMILVSIPFTFTANAWDGTANSSFSGGSGTKEDPYKISEAGDLALLLNDLDMGNTDYAGVYFRITHDLYLNNETCKFIPDTGLVMITDGTNVAYIGTGIKGDASGDNDLFDESASAANYWYASDESTDHVHHYDRDNVYGGELYFSHSSYANTRKAFKGVIDGENHVISGVFSYDDGKSAYADHNGLFFDVFGATVKNISIESSLFFGSAAAGFAGYAEDSIFTNLDFEGIVIGNGGIVAEAVNCDFGECINRGTIIATGDAGGIVGINTAKDELNYIAYCDNEGYVISESANNMVGGIVGNSVTATIEYCENKGVVYGDAGCMGGIAGNTTTATVSRSENRGVVSGGDYTVGGIVGITKSEVYDESTYVKNCTNYGKVYGNGMDVGGVVGKFIGRGAIETCDNLGLVSTYHSFGGIVGSVLSRGETTIKSCRNAGWLEAKDINQISWLETNAVIGGIIGEISSVGDGKVLVTGCTNQIEIVAVGANNVGGIVGNLIGDNGGVVIEKSYNSGNITANNAVGGIAGYVLTKTLDVSDSKFDLVIENCYNSGDIKANEKVGGLVAYVQSASGAGRPFNIKTSYNAGKVDPSGRYGGRIFGYSDYSKVNIVDCYFSEDADMSNSCGSTNKVNDDSSALSLEEMTVSESFTGFDFNSVWEIGRYTNYKYPTIVGLYHETHAHYFARECDETHHWDECDCGATKNKEEHIPELQDRGNGFSDKVCTICGSFLGVVKNETAAGKIGDVNSDGNIDQYDYILIKRHYFSTRILTDDESKRADVNSDSAINQYDYILVKRHYFGTYTIG